MSGFHPFHAHQCQPAGPDRPMESFQTVESAMDASEVDMLDESSDMVGGQTLDEIITQNHHEMQRQRRSMQSMYHPNSDPEMSAPLMPFDPTVAVDLGGFQLSQPQVQTIMVAGVPRVMISNQAGLPVSNLRSSTESLTLDTRFSNMIPVYDTLSSSATFESSLNPGSTPGYDISTYTTPTIGLPFEQGASPHAAPGNGRSMGSYPRSAYGTLPMHVPAQVQRSFSSPHHAPQDLDGRIGSVENTDMPGWFGGAPSVEIPGSGQHTQEISRAPTPAGPIQHTQSSAGQSRLADASRRSPTLVPTASAADTSRSLYVPSVARFKEIAASSEPKPGGGKVVSQYLNIYSGSGFDMFGILARVATRPNPEIDIGAVDMSCAFILCDVTAHDDPIVYVSDAFERLTGYTKHEILGRNCRFLQGPDGKVEAGEKRKYVDEKTAFRLKTEISARSEVQASLINYRKGGQPFMNLLTMIPIRWDSDEYKFFVGFQVDLVEKPHAVTKRNSDGSFAINYQRDQLPRYVLHAPEIRRSHANFSKMISHNEVSAVLNAIGVTGSNFSKRVLEKVLLENSDDMIHVLSLKGLFLYLSPSCRKILEYDTAELVGTALSSICHPSDISPVARELKESTPSTPVSVVYRIRRKHNGYMWFESHGSLHVESGKGRKCLILVGRERPVYALDREAVAKAGGVGENDLWTKVSISGMFLFVSSNVRVVLDRQPGELVGKSIHEFLRPESKPELGKALEVCRTGRQATFRHEFRHRRGHVLQAQTTLYPGDAKEGSKPSFLVAQTRFVKSSRSAVVPPPSSNEELPATTRSAAPLSSSSGSPTSQHVQTQGPFTPRPSQTLDVFVEAGIRGLSSGRQDEALLCEGNMFEELQSTRSSSWQFELRQLERRNRMLAEELQALLSRRKKRKRKKGTGPLEKDCAICHTRNTPEWRKGPSGKRDLCNSCGLRWAKQNGRISPRKSSDQSDKNSNPSSAKPSPMSAAGDKNTKDRPPDHSRVPGNNDNPP